MVKYLAKNYHNFRNEQNIVEVVYVYNEDCNGTLKVATHIIIYKNTNDFSQMKNKTVNQIPV